MHPITQVNNMPVVKTFGDIRKLNIRLKRDDRVQVTKSGGFHKARFRGRASFVFGATSAQAVERLLFSAKLKRWGLVPAPLTTMDKLLLRGLGK
jgi:hypothetical protein